MKRREKRGNISASLDSQKCKREKERAREGGERERDRDRERRNKTNQLTPPTGGGHKPWATVAAPCQELGGYFLALGSSTQRSPNL